jgi:putative heme degradation protein
MSSESNSKPKGPEWDRAALDGDWHALTDAHTVNSLIERHDMYKDVGRIQTRDIRDKSKEAAGV